MKRLSIKLKLTLWFAVAMVLLAGVFFAFITVVSNSTAVRDARKTLQSVVEDNVKEVEYDDGKLDIDDDFRYYRDNIYSAVFDEHGTLIIGRAPDDELLQQAFEDGNIREVTTVKRPVLRIRPSAHLSSQSIGMGSWNNVVWWRHKLHDIVDGCIDSPALVDVTGGHRRLYNCKTLFISHQKDQRDNGRGGEKRRPVQTH